MHARRIMPVLGALLLSLVFAAGASAAPNIEVTYSLGEDTDMATRTVLWHDDQSGFDYTNPVNILFSNAKVVYNGTINSIATGSATIQEMTLGWSGTISYSKGATVRAAASPTNPYWTWGPVFGGVPYGLTLRLTQPVTNANLTPGGHLTAPTLNLHFSGQIKSLKDGDKYYFTSLTGRAALDVPVGSVSAAQTFNNAGTVHWIDGRTSAAGTTCTYCPNATTGGGGYFDGVGTLDSGTFAALTVQYTLKFGTKFVFPEDVTLVGREISRVPEPGSLLLLGSGLAGLAALGSGGAMGRRLRRSRRS